MLLRSWVSESQSVRKQVINCGKRLYQTDTSSCIRSAHSTEIFRSRFYKYSQSDIIISARDLDEIIIQEKVRPSIFLELYGALGTGLGIISRISPKPCSTLLTKIVDDAVSQQLNDSIRELSSAEVIDNCDIKETLKYHRDLKSTNDSEPSIPSILTPEYLTALSFGLSRALAITKTF